MCNRSSLRCAILLVLVAALAATAGFYSGSAVSKRPYVNSAIIPVQRTDVGMAEQQHGNHLRLKEGKVDMLFVGDSITMYWNVHGKKVWDNYYGKRNPLNLGIGGDQTQNVLWRLDDLNLEDIQPKLAVVMIGTNNSHNNTAAEMAEGVEAVVKRLRTRLPMMRILLLAIFPRGDVEAAKLQKLRDASAKFGSAVSFDPMVEYMDIGKIFLNDKGEVTEDIMFDLLHLSEKGYALEAEALEPTITRLLAMADGWTPLFNAKDFSGWEAVGDKSTWHEKGGVLYTEDGGNAWLSTDKEYGDFDLSLEFRVPKGGNGGVIIRAPRTGDPAVEGSRIQVIDDYDELNKDLKPHEHSGSVYATIPAAPRASKPFGEWQKMDIHMQGQKIAITLNGTRVVDGDMDGHMDMVNDHPGLRRQSGHIGLQGQSGGFEYRNVLIREIK